MTWSWNIVMTRILEHCDDKGHGALRWHGHGTLWWQEFWSIVMTRAMEHCGDMVMEHCDDKNYGALWWHGHGTLWWQEFWSIGMTRAMEHCDYMVMEHCNDNREMWWKCLASLVINVVIEICDEKQHRALWWERSWRPRAPCVSLFLLKFTSVVILSWQTSKQWLGQGINNGGQRSEERRVGKECRSRWSPYH